MSNLKPDPEFLGYFCMGCRTPILKLHEEGIDYKMVSRGRWDRRWICKTCMDADEGRRKTAAKKRREDRQAHWERIGDLYQEGQE